jgi:hypothetical protein
MPRVAIIYTGEVRTIEKVIGTFKKNVLIDKSRDVFAVLQSTDIFYFDDFVKQQLYGHLKYLRWFNREDAQWITLRNSLCKDMNLSNEWTSYLRDNSGSMIEYYQLYLAFLDIKKYEEFTGIKYDYVFRIRCDCVITRPLYFDLDNIDIQDRLNRIKEVHGKEGNIIEIFMNSLHDIRRINLKDNIDRRSVVSNGSLGLPGSKNTVDVLRKYLDNGKFLITLRENVCYFGRRDAFEAIHKLGIQYGKSRSYDKGYWFDSESQLKSVCLDNKVDIYDSTTTLEVQSLYEYNRDNYYKGDELIDRDDVFFFLYRQ